MVGKCPAHAENGKELNQHPAKAEINNKYNPNEKTIPFTTRSSLPDF
jgi:hypothetical protein